MASPTVTTQTCKDVTNTTATGRGNITATGGESITAHGHCWSTSINPTVNGEADNGAGAVGTFTSAITSLTAGTGYYTRAYATNASGTSYGANVYFIASLDRAGYMWMEGSNLRGFDANAIERKYIHTNDVDDTAVNAATADPISSNWAFDHATDTDAHGEPVVTCDTSSATADDLAFSIVGGAGIDTSGATTVVTITGEAASTSNAGIVQLENPPTEDDATKAATSEYIFDHNANVDAHHQKDRIQDADGQSYVEVGATTDQTDFKNANVTTGEISATGIVTWAKQSRCRVYRTTYDQVIPTGITVYIHFNGETYDSQNEFDSTSKAGTDDRANGEGADHLIDDGNAQFASGDVGAIVWNRTDNTYATVTAHSDAGDLTLSDAIMANGEVYVLYHSKFTVTEAGIYQIRVGYYLAGLGDTKYAFAYIAKNGVVHSAGLHRPGSTGNLSLICADMLELAASDYITGHLSHNHGSNLTLYGNTGYTWMSIHKLS